MNREIKFRGKRLDNSEWVYGDLMHDNHGGCYIYPLDAESLYTENKVAQNTVGQFTGLYDKNGKEIYEGDILKVECTDGSSIYKIVRFVPEKAAFCMANTFEIKDEGRWDIWFYVSQRGIKEIEASVIGNIYDNPELLK